MPPNILLILTGILSLGIGAQWLAWRLRLPSILLLLGFGITVGPVTGLLKPGELFGDLLQPIVSMSVALILFEGGLTLRFQELKESGKAVWRLVSLGALVTWALAGALAYFVLGLPLGLATLLGAVLIVTGPTVIQPLLQHIKPTGAVGKILKWEGIVIDPIGALIAVLVFEAMLHSGTTGITSHTLIAVAKTLFLGGALGAIGAISYVQMAKRFWIPDDLLSAVALTLAIVVFAVANQFQHESGLFSVTLMGVLLANQHSVDVEEVIEFKENLRVLLISGLFIVLGARLDLQEVLSLGGGGILFVAALILVVRPLSVYISTMGIGLKNNDRIFLSWMAPRGIVAAAVASIFALELEHAGVEGASRLVAATFAVILGTVIVYGLTAPILATRIGIAESNPQGILFIGAGRWQRALAELLKSHGFRTLLVDTNRRNTQAARMAGLSCMNGSVLNEHFVDRMELGGIGRVFAATPNDLVNVLAVKKLTRIFGRANAYQVAPITPGEDKKTQKKAEGRTEARILFDEKASWQDLERRIATKSVFKATPLSEEFTLQNFREMYGEKALPLFVLNEKKKLEIFEADEELEADPGDTLISLVEEPPEEEKPAEEKTSGDESPEASPAS